MATAPMRERCDQERPGPDLARLFDETLPRLYGYFRARVGGDQSVAEELMQETYLAAARALAADRVRVDEPVGWLFGIARHKLIDHYRRRELTEDRRRDWDEEIDEIPGTDDDLDRIADRDELITALAQLPAGQRLALVLHYADGLSVAETAIALDRSEHAVESLLARGRRSLRARLTDLETTP
jgi:RNA polymerase sigma-70 factor (ECF subfamily)